MYPVTNEATMPRVVLHIGIARTATTTLQQELFSKHPQIAYLGKPFNHEDATPGSQKAIQDRLPAKIIRAIRDQDSLDYDAVEVKRQLDNALATVAVDGKVVLLSEEGWSSAGGADRRLIAERLRELFGPCDIIITVRNQLTCLPSLFLHYLKKGIIDNVSFDQWLKLNIQLSEKSSVAAGNWIIRQGKYFNLFELYRDVFRKENVKVLIYEKLITDLKGFCEDLADSINIDAGESFRLLSESKHLNAVPTYNAIRFKKKYRSIEATFARITKRIAPTFDMQTDAPLLWRSKESVLRRAVALTDKANARENPARCSPDSIELLKDYYAAGNRNLAAACNLPLGDYGYPI